MPRMLLSKEKDDGKHFYKSWGGGGEGKREIPTL